MRTRYKMVEFVKSGDGGWLCFHKSSNTLIGRVFYGKVSQEFKFKPVNDSVLNSTMLVSISQFMDQLALM